MQLPSIPYSISAIYSLVLNLYYLLHSVSYAHFVLSISLHGIWSLQCTCTAVHRLTSSAKSNQLKGSLAYIYEKEQRNSWLERDSNQCPLRVTHLASYSAIQPRIGLHGGDPKIQQFYFLVTGWNPILAKHFPCCRLFHYLLFPSLFFSLSIYCTWNLICKQLCLV